MAINSPGGKGSGPRPFGVDKQTFNNNWDAIFGNKSKEQQDVKEDTHQHKDQQNADPH